MQLFALTLAAVLPLTGSPSAPCGWFSSPLNTAVGTTPHAFASADFNEDGILDLAVANYASHNISVLIGAGAAGVGNGTFLPAVNYASGQYPLDVQPGDFNGDGRVDLVVSVQSQIAVYFGRGSGTTGDGSFDPAAYIASSGFRPRGLLVGDFNEDGIDDLAITNGAGTTVGIRFGLGANGVGNGAFGAETVYFTGLGIVRVASGDFNEDGISDLVTTSNHPTSNRVSILIGNGIGSRGDGTFDPAVHYAAGTAPFGIALGDFNADLVQDLAVTNAGSNDVSIFLGNGSNGNGNGTFGPSSPVALAAAPREIEAGDFDADGATDLAVALSNGEIAVLKGLTTAGVPNGSFANITAKSAGTSPLSLEAGDFLEDGVPDIVATNSGGGSVSVLSGTCAPEVPPSIQITTPGASTTWGRATEHVITWTKTPTIRAVTIEVSRDNGMNWQTIATDVVDPSFRWIVTPPNSSSVLIRVRDRNALSRSATSPSISVSEVSGVPGDPAGTLNPSAAPNPFRETVTFRVLLSSATDLMDVTVHDVSGRLVKRLHSGPAPAGERSFTWDGQADDGSTPPPGIYFVRAGGPGTRGVVKVVRVD